MNVFEKKDYLEETNNGHCSNYGLNCFNCTRYNQYTGSCGRYKIFTETHN